jgi:metal-responsive CopG/Arc/MetJ family transcriptional regulator
MSTHHKATYTLPQEVLDELNTFVEQRQRSRFVAEAVRLALVVKRQELEDAYKEAAADQERTKEVEEWSTLDVEGWDE